MQKTGGRLQPEQKATADDRVNSYGEWLSMAMLREGNLLHCYFDPENLVWDGNKYTAQGEKLKHAGEEVYSIGSMNRWVSIKDVNEINPALVEKLWSRHYAILPEEVRQKAWLLIPSENSLLPVSRGNYINRYVIDFNSNFKVSRGVRFVSAKRYP